MEYNVFSALGDKQRLEIVELLKKHPRNVNELSSLLGLRQPHTSKELKTLADAGIVNVKKIKQNHFYSLSPDKFNEINLWLKRFSDMREKRPNRFENLIKRGMKENGKH